MSNISYTFVFEKKGTPRKSSALMRNEIWLDVGNYLGDGYFDHHQVVGYESALKALCEEALKSGGNYLDQLKSCVEKEPQNGIIVHLHEEPDMDCISSFYILNYYISNGQERFKETFGSDINNIELLKYMNDIDTGINKITDKPTLYAIVCAIGEGDEDSKSSQRDRSIVEKGRTLIEWMIEKKEIKTKEDLENKDLTGALSEDAAMHEMFATELNYVSENSEDVLYDKEKKDGVLTESKISVWNQEMIKYEDIEATIWEKPSAKDYHGYNVARKRNHVLTVCPRVIKGESSPVTEGPFTSIDPKYNKADHGETCKYDLRPIVEIIEQMEQIEEQRLYEHTGKYRRDYSRPRGNEGHLGEPPFSTTSDPWFVKPSGDVFDSPRAGSLLDYEDIKEVIKNNGSAVRKAYVISTKEKKEERIDYCLGLEDLCVEKPEPLSIWKKRVSKSISESRKEGGHMIIWAELDASLIRHNNRILEAYCLNLIGKSFHECDRSSFLFPDYHTCIYSDLSCTIILTAIPGVPDPEKELEMLAIKGLLSIGSIEEFMGSPLIQCITKTAGRREELLKHSENISKLKLGGHHKDVERVNRELLTLSIEMQKDGIIRNPVERDIYEFIKEGFGISELKSQVMEEMSIIINESRDNMVSRFNALSAFAVPFIIIATVFQMGLLHIEEALNVRGYPGKLIAWLVVIILTALWINYLRVKNKSDK